MRDPHFRSVFRVQKWSREVSNFNCEILSSLLVSPPRSPRIARLIACPIIPNLVSAHGFVLVCSAPDQQPDHQINNLDHQINNQESQTNNQEHQASNQEHHSSNQNHQTPC